MKKSKIEKQKKIDVEFDNLLKDYKIIITDNFTNQDSKEIIKEFIHYTNAF